MHSTRLTQKTTEITQKLNAKAIHVPRMRGDTRLDTTAFIYFESDDDLAATTSKEEKIYYQSRLLHLVPLSEKACHACGSPDHMLKQCNARPLRYKLAKEYYPEHLRGWDEVDERPQNRNTYT